LIIAIEFAGGCACLYKGKGSFYGLRKLFMLTLLVPLVSWLGIRATSQKNNNLLVQNGHLLVHRWFKIKGKFL